MDDLKGRQELYNGFGETMVRGVEFALTLAIFAGLGYGLDRLLGMVPVFTIGMFLLGAVGLAVKTYYAYEPNATNPTYWAAAALAGPKSEMAAINLQDQNSYMMFYKGADPAARWVPIAAGFGPIPAGEQPCPIPQSIRDVWQWPTGKCYPPPA